MTIFFTRTISKYQKQNVLHQNCGDKKKFNLCIKCVSLKLMIHWQIPIYCAVRIPLLDIYLFSVSLYPDSSSLSLFPVWHWSKFTKLIWFYFAICAQKPFFKHPPFGVLVGNDLAEFSSGLLCCLFVSFGLF